MATYDNVITRGSGSWPGSPAAGGQNLVPLEQSAEIISAVPQESAALQMFRHVPMSRLQERVPVLSVLPQASFVSGSELSGAGAPWAGLKPTTFANWEGRYLQAEPVACIVPVPEELLADSQYDIWGELTPHIASAIGRALDAAVFFGAGKPPSFPAPIADQAYAAGHSVQAGTASQANGALAADIANLFATVENDGFEIDGIVARIQMRARVRNARMTIGAELPEISTEEWYGRAVKYPLRGLWPQPSSTFTGNTTNNQKTVTNIADTSTLSPGETVTGAGIAAGTTIASVDSANQITLSQNATATAAGVSLTTTSPLAIVGDFSQGLLGVRQDLTFKVLDQATLTDNTGAVQINLAQQDAVALRVVARFGFAVANAVTYDNPNEATRWPFGVLVD